MAAAAFDWNDVHPVLSAWFRQSFGQPTDVQQQVWREFAPDEHVLIAAPTGSGKTLAALLPGLDAIVKAKSVSVPEGREAYGYGVRLLYVTPLKALNNDIHHHVVQFAGAMEQLAAERGLDWPGLRVGVRTGDTPQNTRASMLRQPPDVLVTTPESLYLLLTSSKAREMLRTVERVIVDEIHDLAADGRGTHLSLTLERLVELCGRSPQRIGVSATQKPLERVAQFLAGWEERGSSLTGDARMAGGAEQSEQPDQSVQPDQFEQEHQVGSVVRDGQAEQPESVDQVRQFRQADNGIAGAVDESSSASYGVSYRPRKVRIVESRMDKTFDILVTMPDRTLITADKEAVWTPLVERLLQLMEGSRSTIIFANNRRLCERLTLRLNDHVGHELARSHHGSVAREVRLDVERALKSGELRCLVATSSLELGIDVGHVDLVLQLDSPQSAASGVQRVGRAGHAVGDVSRGVIVARSRGALAECALLARLVARRDIEDIRIPADALDVLCQQVVAMAAGDDWTVARLGAVLARSDAYRGLTRARLESALAVLAGFFPFVRPLLEWDREAGVVRRSKTTAMAAIMGAGTIPQSTAYPVHHAQSRVHLGELDEEYIHESRVGDVFQLGTASWKIQSIQNDRVYVTEADNTFSEIPFWRAEAPGRSYELSVKLGELLEELDRRISTGHDADSAQWLMDEYRLDGPAAEQLIALVKAQQTAGVPTHRKIIVEHYQDEIGQHHVIFHSWFGRRLNRSWQLVLQKRLMRYVPSGVYAASKDNGIEFVMPEWDASWLPSMLAVSADDAETLLRDSIPGSPLFGMTFRRLIETSLLLPRTFSRMPAWKRRLRGDELLRAALPYASQFPFVTEAGQLCLAEQLDSVNVKRLVGEIGSGTVQITIRESIAPSPFAAQFASDFVNTQIYESDAIAKDLQAHLLTLNRELAGQLFDRASLQRELEIAAEQWTASETVVRDEDDLVRLLKRSGDMPPEEIASQGELQETAPIAELLTSLERQHKASRITIAGRTRWISADEADTYAQFPANPGAAAFVLSRYIDRQLYFTAEQLCETYGLTQAEAGSYITSWERDGTIEKSPFAEPDKEDMWTSSRALGRMIRISANHKRSRQKPVDPSRYIDELLVLQYVRSDYRREGIEGLKEAIARLQGLFLPLSHWESIVLPSRMMEYRKEWLDSLCASGDILWVGHKEPADKEGKLAFFLAETADLYPANGFPDSSSILDPELSQLYELLQRKGASFLTAICREVGLPPSETMEKLLELVWLGKVSNDQFAPLRLHGSRSSKPAAKQGKGKAGAFQSGLGRWYALQPAEVLHGQDRERSAVGWVHHLLQSYAVVTKEVAEQQSFVEWSKLQDALKQLEHWGLMTRGFWIAGIPYLQFGASETVERLRQPLPQASPAAGSELTLLSSVDPANPYGLMLKWPEGEGLGYSRKPGNFLLIENGEWVLWVENNGRRIHPLTDSWKPGTVKQDLMRDVFKRLFKIAGLRKLVIDSWRGADFEEEKVAAAFGALGAERDRASMVIWPSGLR